MPFTHVDLISHWHIAAPVVQVWPALADPRGWPQWWHGIGGVHMLRPEGLAGIGSLCRLEVAGAWPLRMTVDIETINAAMGEQLRMRTHGWLQGEAIWLLRVEGSGTAITCVWRVEWLGLGARVLALLASPLLRWNHRVLMHAGEAGLRRHLAA